MSAVSTCRMLHREAMKESYHVGIEILSTVFSPANLRILPPPLPHCWLLYCLRWDWGGANGFYVDTDSTQSMYSQYTFNSDLGEHCKGGG